MASYIKKGEKLLIPFRNGISIGDSQCRPRMYKSKGVFERSFPGYYLGTEDIELVEYAEVVHGHWIVDESGVIICSQCGAEHEWQDYRASFCEDCGAKMDGERREGE